MPIAMPAMPYGFDAFEPYLGRIGLKLHFELYHKGAVEKVNSATAGSPLADHTLYQIVRKAWGHAPRTLLANACEALNHEFYWNSMRPGGGGLPADRLAAWIERSYGSAAHFMRELRVAAMDHPGNGWLWVVLDLGRLKIMTTSGASTPVAYGHLPLLALDLWQHAYDLEFGNRRDQYVDRFFRDLVNWRFANEVLSKAELACGHDSESRPAPLQAPAEH